MELPVQKSANAQVIDRQWWNQFNDPMLNQLISNALESNRDLHLAIARVDEARALLAQAQASQYPSLALGGAVGRPLYTNINGSPLDSNLISRIDMLGASASYQVDFWGQYRRASEAARANLLASEANRNNVELTVTSEVARAYFSLLAFDARLDVASLTLKASRDNLALRKAQFEAGALSELVYKQVEAETANAQIALSKYEQASLQAENALKILIGASPRAIVEQSISRGLLLNQITVPPAIPADLPSELLLRRPDLQQAEQQLVAANARIGEAKAGYFPSFALTSSLRRESVALASLFSGHATIWSIGAGFVMPMIDFGETRAKVAAADARTKQALAVYEKAVQSAFSDAYYSLVANGKIHEQQVALQGKVDATQQALKLAQLRFDNGYSSYLEVLDTERSLYAAQTELVNMKEMELDAVVNVYQALGGGW